MMGSLLPSVALLLGTDACTGGCVLGLSRCVLAGKEACCHCPLDICGGRQHPEVESLKLGCGW